MDYIKIRFSKKIRPLHSKQDLSLEDVFRSLNPMFCADERSWTPQSDIYETPDEVIIRVEIAGVDKENLEVAGHCTVTRISDGQLIAGRDTPMQGVIPPDEYLVVCSYEGETLKKTVTVGVVEPTLVNFYFGEKPYPYSRGHSPLQHLPVLAKQLFKLRDTFISEEIHEKLHPVI